MPMMPMPVPFGGGPKDSHYIVAGCVVRNASAVAAAHSLALANQTRRPDSLLYLIHDDEPIEVRTPDGLVEIDQTPTAHALLSTVGDWLRPGPGGWESPGERRLEIKTNSHPTAAMADLRIEHMVHFLDEFPNATHLLVVDIDIELPPDTISVMLSNDWDSYDHDGRLVFLFERATVQAVVDDPTDELIIDLPSSAEPTH